MKLLQYAQEDVVLGQNNADALLKNNPWRLVLLGLIEETGEVLGIIKKHEFHNRPLDREKLKLEIGDVFWYIALAYRAMEWEMPDHIGCRVAGDATDHCVTVSCAMSECINRVRDVIFWQSTRFTEISLLTLAESLVDLAAHHDITLDEILDANVSKLRKRHPNGWSPESQAAKADESP